MKKDLLHTPEGVRDIYSTECAEKKVIENRLHDVCASYGYNDIQTPSIEFFDVFNKERGSVPSNEMFKLFDRYGNTLVLRPDMTPSIARATAKYFEDRVLPVKLCYLGNTFINVSKYYQGRLKENTMLGAELINDNSLAADYEIISMVIDCMLSAGLTEFQVELGNVAFFNGLLHKAGITGDSAEELLRLIKDKNYFGVEELLDSLNIDDAVAKALLELPQLFGGTEVLEKAKSLTDEEECIQAVNRLEELYELLKNNNYDKYISFDLGDLSEHAYYTGIIFHAYTFGTGEPVVNGGRYDKLLGQFDFYEGEAKRLMDLNLALPAYEMVLKAGHTFNLLDANGTLLVYNADRLGDAINVSKKLRSTGVNVCMIEYKDSKSDSQYIEYAKESSLVNVAFIDDEYASDSTIRVIDESEKNERAAVKSLVGGTF